jgi:hypothetical protein
VLVPPSFVARQHEEADDHEGDDRPKHGAELDGHGRILPSALCRSEYHELIEDPDEVTQHEDGDDDPEHDKPGETWPKVIIHRFDSFLVRYFGRVQGNSPGCFSDHANPLHSEFGSVGGPHHGTRSSHQYSPVKLFRTARKPMSINTADVIASAISKRLLVLVTEAPYVVVTGVSGSLKLSP